MSCRSCKVIASAARLQMRLAMHRPTQRTASRSRQKQVSPVSMCALCRIMLAPPHDTLKNQILHLTSCAYESRRVVSCAVAECRSGHFPCWVLGPYHHLHCQADERMQQPLERRYTIINCALACRGRSSGGGPAAKAGLRHAAESQQGAHRKQRGICTAASRPP